MSEIKLDETPTLTFEPFIEEMLAGPGTEETGD